MSIQMEHNMRMFFIKNTFQYYASCENVKIKIKGILAYQKGKIHTKYVTHENLLPGFSDVFIMIS